MIDRRTKNAEIFRDTERRYTTDQALVQAVRQSTEAQVFIAEKTTVGVPAPSNMMNPHAGDKAAKITPSELEQLLTARIR